MKLVYILRKFSNVVCWALALGFVVSNPLLIKDLNAQYISLRKEPKQLDLKDVSQMLKELDFYSAKVSNFNEKYSNPDGSGYENKFSYKIIQIDSSGIMGVVVDSAAMLMWEQSLISSYEIDPEYYISTLNAKSYAGFTDWRLPSLEEVLTLMEKDRISTCKTRHLNSIFWIYPMFFIRSSDRYIRDFIWVINITEGYTQYVKKSMLDGIPSVMAVRDIK